MQFPPAEADLAQTEANIQIYLDTLSQFATQSASSGRIQSIQNQDAVATSNQERQVCARPSNKPLFFDNIPNPLTLYLPSSQQTAANIAARCAANDLINAGLAMPSLICGNVVSRPPCSFFAANLLTILLVQSPATKWSITLRSSALQRIPANTVRSFILGAEQISAETLLPSISTISCRLLP
jgi:hypothetical protein